MNNPLSPLTNKTISGQYAPGSTFKIAVMLAALEAGISPEKTAFCSGHIKLGNQRFHCWKRAGHGAMTMIEAMRESCDTWFYTIALKLGIDKIAEAAQRLGLGETLGVDLDGEKPGLIPTRAWKKAVIGRRWQRGETLISAIGQGYVLTTPLQLAVMMARVINGGHAITPKIQREPPSGAGDEEIVSVDSPSIGYSAEALKLVATALDSVVNNPRGTAYKSRIRTPSMAMGGKTGTAQVRRISVAERKSGILKNNQLMWRERDHALFVGFAPVNDPRYAISVVVEHGGGGSSKAAPIAKDIPTRNGISINGQSIEFSQSTFFAPVMAVELDACNLAVADFKHRVCNVVLCRWRKLGTLGVPAIDAFGCGRGVDDRRRVDWRSNLDARRLFCVRWRVGAVSCGGSFWCSANGGATMDRSESDPVPAFRSHENSLGPGTGALLSQFEY